MFRTVLCLVVCLSSSVFAASRADLLSRAAEGVKEAVDEVQDAPAACRKKLAGKVESLDDALRAAKKDQSDASVKSARRAADQAADVAREACTGSAGKRLVKALEAASSSFDDALSAKEDAAPPPVLNAIAQGIGGLFAGAAQAHSETTTSSKSTSKTTRTEQVNGEDLEEGEPRENERPAKKEKKSDGPKRGEFGATCRNNGECDSNTCYLGSGSIGYCTKICSEDDDCPRKMFEWTCYRPRNLNAPQKLCLQSN